MNDSVLATEVISAARDSIRWLRATKTPHVLIGGIAVSLLCRPRTTKDVDFVVNIDESKIEAWIESGRRYGITPFVKGAAEFALQSRIALMVHQKTATKIDLALSGSPFELELLANATNRRIGNTYFRLPQPAYLIVLKAIAGRLHDIADVETILDAYPDVDLEWARRWVVQFGEILESDDPVTKFDQYVADRQRRQRLK